MLKFMGMRSSFAEDTYSESIHCSCLSVTRDANPFPDLKPDIPYSSFNLSSSPIKSNIVGNIST